MHIKEFLDQAQIQTIIKNQRSAMLGGKVPFVEVFPEPWVLKDEKGQIAQSHIRPPITLAASLVRYGLNSGAVYHLTSRGNTRQNIVRDNRARPHFLPLRGNR